MKLFPGILLLALQFAAHAQLLLPLRKANEPAPGLGGGGGGGSTLDTCGTMWAWWKPDGGLVTNNVGTVVSTNTGNGNDIQYWGDSSGNSRVLQQPTGTAYPNWQTNQINGYPAMLFGGSDFLEHIKSSALASSVIMIVGEVSSGSLGSFAFAIDSTNSASRQAIYKGSSDVIEAYSGTSGVTNSSASSGGTFYLFTGVFDAAGNDRLYVNGTLVKTGDSGSGNLDGVNLGINQARNFGWNARIAEGAVFNGTNVDLTTAHTLLKTKYNLP